MKLIRLCHCEDTQKIWAVKKRLAKLGTSRIGWESAAPNATDDPATKAWIPNNSFLIAL